MQLFFSGRMCRIASLLEGEGKVIGDMWEMSWMVRLVEVDGDF